MTLLRRLGRTGLAVTTSMLLACSGAPAPLPAVTTAAPTAPATTATPSPTPASTPTAAATAVSTPIATPRAASTPTAAASAAPPPPAAATPPPANVATDIAGFAFAAVTATRGSTVTWTNRDTVDHDIVADDGSFHSPTIQPGQSFTLATDRAGTFAYHCSIHPFMTSSVTIR
jgi:plastocyanin